VTGGTNRIRGPFSSHADQSVTPAFMRVNGGTRPRYRASPARADHAAGPDRAAGAGEVQQLLADAATGPEHVCAGGNNHRPAHGAAWRQACQIGRRAVSAGRHRPRNTGADAGGWQHAGDPTARQPRRRSLDPAEIARFKFNTTLAVCIARRPSYDVALVPPRPGPEKRTVHQFRADGFASPFCARSLSKVQSVEQRMRLGRRCRLLPTAAVPSHTSGAAMCTPTPDIIRTPNSNISIGQA
jgi:hypothetical protein